MAKHEFTAISAPLGADYLKTAVLFAERAKRVEGSPPEDAFERSLLHRSLVTSSILAATCSLEATINEWFSYAMEIGGRGRVSTRKRVEQLWSLGVPRTASFHILQKYQVALALTGIPTMSEGKEPYQSARCLVELRNWLVHYEPTWEPTAGHEDSGLHTPHKLFRRLRGKFPLNPLCASHAPFWPYKCLSAGCALWATACAHSFMNDFFESCDPKSASRIDKTFFDKARQLGQSAGWGAYGV